MHVFGDGKAKINLVGRGGWRSQGLIWTDGTNRSEACHALGLGASVYVAAAVGGLHRSPGLRRSIVVRHEQRYDADVTAVLVAELGSSTSSHSPRIHIV